MFHIFIHFLNFSFFVRHIVCLYRHFICLHCHWGKLQLFVKNYHYLCLIPFDPEALETCKNTINLQKVLCLVKGLSKVGFSGDFVYKHSIILEEKLENCQSWIWSIIYIKKNSVRQSIENNLDGQKSLDNFLC